MKKLNSSLLLIAACTGLFLAGCNQKPADKPAVSKETATGTIKIEEASQKSTTSGSMDIVESNTTGDTMVKTTDAMVKATTPAATEVTGGVPSAQDPVLMKIQADAEMKAAQALKDSAAASKVINY